MKLTAKIVFEAVNQGNKDSTFMCPLNALGVTAQTYLETGNYEHTGGKDNVNLGGIKCSSNWLDGRIPWSTKKCLNLTTQEFTNEIMKDKTLWFRWYPTLTIYLKDHARLINLFYPKSKLNEDCVWGYISGLDGKWATDPDYFKKLTKLIMQLSPSLLGSNWKDMLVNSYYVAQDRGVLTPAQCIIIHQYLFR